MSEDKLDLTAYERDVVEHGLFGAARARMLNELSNDQAWQVALDQGRITFGGKPYRCEILGTYA